MSGDGIARTFERFEFKYFAPQALAEAALASAGDVLREDEVARQAGATQLNTSLYLDSPRLTFLEQHVSASPDRIKLRVRYYGEQPGSACFFEVKRRQNAVVMKERAVLPLLEARTVLEDLSRALPAACAADPVLQRFQYLALRCFAGPRLLVRARRSAFRATDRALDVRVTVDRQIMWQPPRRPDVLTPRDEAWRHLRAHDASGPLVLVEVKFKDARPWWLGALCRTLAPYRLSFSKYVAAAVEARRDPFFIVDAA